MSKSVAMRAFAGLVVSAGLTLTPAPVWAFAGGHSAGGHSSAHSAAHATVAESHPAVDIALGAAARGGNVAQNQSPEQSSTSRPSRNSGDSISDEGLVLLWVSVGLVGVAVVRGLLFVAEAVKETPKGPAEPSGPSRTSGQMAETLQERRRKTKGAAAYGRERDVLGVAKMGEPSVSTKKPRF